MAKDINYLADEASQVIRYLAKALTKSNICKKHPVVVAAKSSNDDYVIGWNGAPIGVDHPECLRKDYPSGEGMHLCPGIHAEVKLVGNAQTQGISLKGATIYMNEWYPCAPCMMKLAEAGIKELQTPDKIYCKDGKTLIEKLRKQSYNFEKSDDIRKAFDIELVINPLLRF